MSNFRIERSDPTPPVASPSAGHGACEYCPRTNVRLFEGWEQPDDTRIKLCRACLRMWMS